MTSRHATAPRHNPRYACYRLRIARSRIHRFGVYACEPIPARRKVMEYTGERVNRRETRRRSLAALRSRGTMLIYLARLDSYWALDGSVGGSGAEYVNHSCDPNLRPRKVAGHLLLCSKRRIAAGEELTADYRLPKNTLRILCHCGSRKCRGTLNLTELREKRNHPARTARSSEPAKSGSKGQLGHL